jgi:glycosyltransferase involved in cell wall biosynthesis
LEDGVHRVWTSRWEPDLGDLERAIDDALPEILHIQFNFGFFDLDHLARLIADQLPQRPVVLSLHRTRELEIDGQRVHLADVAEMLRSVDRIIVHQRADATYLAGIGVDSNVEVVPLGTPAPPVCSPAEAKAALRLTDGPLIGAFGFLLPHKGTLELLEAVRRLRADHPGLKAVMLCARHPAPSSPPYEEECRRFIRRHGLDDDVLLVTDFLDDATARGILRACDAIVLPYLETEESSSATLRFVLSAERPIVATDLAIFADAKDALYLVPPANPDAVVAGVDRVLRDDQLRTELAERAAAARRRFDWHTLADRHVDIYWEVLRARAEASER